MTIEAGDGVIFQDSLCEVLRCPHCSDKLAFQHAEGTLYNYNDKEELYVTWTCDNCHLEMRIVVVKEPVNVQAEP